MFQCEHHTAFAFLAASGSYSLAVVAMQNRNNLINTQRAFLTTF